MSRLDRVTFFSERDLAGWSMLEKAAKLLDQEHDFTQMALNDLLEFHHIHQYFEAKQFPDQCTPEQKTIYLQTVKVALEATRNYLLKIIPDTFVSEANGLEYTNRENFWILLQYFELYKKVDSDHFLAALAGNALNVRYILTLRQLVQHYNHELRSYLLSLEDCAELILSHFEEKQTEPSNYVFPKSLTDADKHQIIAAYLETAEPNLNYVELAKNSKHLKLPVKLLLQAKQTAERIKKMKFLPVGTPQKSPFGPHSTRHSSNPPSFKIRRVKPAFVMAAFTSIP